MAKDPERTGDLQAERSAGGRFRPGTSGNPRGRPKGARNRASVMARELLEEAVPAVVSKLITMASEGHPVALRLVVERLLPRAGREVREELPGLVRASDLAAGLAEVVRLAAAGEISLEEAREFGRLLELERRAIETEELAVRLEALERVS